MNERNLAGPLQALSEEMFGTSLAPERAHVIESALGDILAEIKRLRSLNLSGVDPVVVFDPVNAARRGEKS